jgi:O-methyltransferase involved in polyketide biosynthesis
MLGAGLCTRPWRLDLPPDVAWFEVDQADLIAHKRRALAAAGAQQQHVAWVAEPRGAMGHCAWLRGMVRGCWV